MVAWKDLKITRRMKIQTSNFVARLEQGGPWRISFFDDNASSFTIPVEYETDTDSGVKVEKIPNP
jgi:hypothetical protein